MAKKDNIIDDNVPEDTLLDAFFNRSKKKQRSRMKGTEYRRARREDIRERKRNYREQRRDARIDKRMEKGTWLKLFLAIFTGVGLFIINFVPKNLSLAVLIALIIIILFIAYTRFVFVFGLVLIVLLIFAYWLFFFTGYGTDLVSEFEKSNVVGETEEELEESGVEHQINIIGKILSGDFEPEELWTSETVESEYTVQEEFDIVLEDIAPRKEYFKNNESIYLTGRINLISGFDKTTTVAITTEPSDFCAESSVALWDELKEKTKIDNLEEFAGLDDEEKEELVGCSDGSDWQCYISGSDDVNTFQMERIYNRQIYCNHTGVEVDEEETVSNLKVNWEYATSAVAGKQVYAFDSDVVSSYEGNPLDKYEIDENSYKSWYVGDRQINLGLGLTGSNDYVRGENEEDIFREVTDLAITIQNTGSGKISEIESLSISFPNNDQIQVGDEIEAALDEKVLFNGPTTEIIAIRGEDIVTRKFTLLPDAKAEFEELEPADHTTFYLPFVVTEEYIGDSAFQSFLIKAEIRYKYRDYETTSVTIRP